MNDDAYAVNRFEQFWPHYVRLHRRRETQALHAVATLTAGALVTAAVLTRRPVLALVAPLADYVIAQASHRVFERNVTEPWRNTLWHARAELRMFRLVVTGRMADEVARHAPLHAST